MKYLANVSSGTEVGKKLGEDGWPMLDRLLEVLNRIIVLWQGVAPRVDRLLDLLEQWSPRAKSDRAGLAAA